MSAVVADGLAAGAEAGDRHAHPEDEVVAVAVGTSLKVALVVDQAAGTARWGRPLEEIGEAGVQVRALGVEPLLHGVKDDWEGAHGDLAAVLVHDLDEATHVCPLKVVGQADRESQVGYRVLRLV